MSLTDAIVAVSIHIVARMPIVQVHVGRAVGIGTGAELRQVTGVTGLSTRSPSWF